MVIRKQFKFEGSHIVRCCSSERCALSIHGHSYVVEVFLKSKTLDKGGMVLDFGLLKPFKQVVDMFDHTHLIWSGDLIEYKEDVKKWCKRWIELPFNPSAENLAFLFHRHLLLSSLMKSDIRCLYLITIFCCVVMELTNLV